jgi:triphosphoribosyl-dephospho-CoA synthase
MGQLADIQLRKRTLPEALADHAVWALLEEAQLSPKPGLVDQRGSGAHKDLSLALMQASARALWPAFHEMALAAESHGAIDGALRTSLGTLGREGEAQMMRATGGVNTHRGAIWALGLLTAATALDVTREPRIVAEKAARIARLPDPAATNISGASHGQHACRTYGVRGAREQAQDGFPAVMQHGLPQLERSRTAGAPEPSARLDALLAVMTQLSDTCVLHRGGMKALVRMQSGAQAVLAAGGSASLAGRRALRQLDRTLLALNASPGGAADLLAATLFLDGLKTVPADFRSQ